MRVTSFRKGLFTVAALGCASCWVYTFGTLLVFGHPGVARWTAMVTVSAIATEATVWVGAFTLGWSAFSNRRRFWSKLKTRITGNRDRIAEDEAS